MPTVTYNNETYTCTTALKGPDYIHLLDASGEMTHAFDIVDNFTTYSITDGDWTAPTEEDNCQLAVVGDDGVIRSGSKRVIDIPTSAAQIGAAAAGHSHTPASLGAASLDGSGKLDTAQASADILAMDQSVTIDLPYAGRFVWSSAESAITITIPADETVAFPIDTEIEVCQGGAGAITFAAAEGVSLLSLDSAKTTAGQFGCVCLKKINTNQWVLAGALG